MEWLYSDGEQLYKFKKLTQDFKIASAVVHLDEVSAFTVSKSLMTDPD